MLARRSGIDKKREYAEKIAGITKDKDFEKIVGKSEEQYWKETKKKIDDKKVKIC